MGCIKLSILDEQYKKAELKVSSQREELTSNFFVGNACSYAVFGTTSYRSGRSEIEVSTKRYKYNGKERDEETGLYAYGMRYYAAWICRFVSVDPLQFEYPELTPFQYASNNPVSMIDLDGAEGIKISSELKQNKELRQAVMTVIRSDAGKELFKDFVTKRQAKQYWGTNEEGKYSKNVNIIFKDSGGGGGQVVSSINKQEYTDIQDAIDAGFDTSKILKKTIDASVKLSSDVFVGTGIAVEGLVGSVLTVAHEVFIHLSYDLEFIRTVLSNPTLDASKLLIEGLSGDYFDASDNVPGLLTSVYQHFILAVEGGNASYKSFINWYSKTLTPEELNNFKIEQEKDFEGVIDEGKSHDDKWNLIRKNE